MLRNAKPFEAGASDVLRMDAGKGLRFVGRGGHMQSI
jgi:hypothetical protein